MFKSCCPFWLMLFQVLRKIVPPPPNLAKTRWNILGTFTFKQQVNVFFFFFAIFLKQKSLCEKKCFEKPKRGGEKKCLETLQPHLCLVNKASLFHAVCCGRMCFLCASACVCLSHNLSVIYCSSNTLPPFCLLVDCHGEGGYNTERHKSGHFLPLSPTSRGSLSCYKHD